MIGYGQFAEGNELHALIKKSYIYVHSSRNIFHLKKETLC